MIYTIEKYSKLLNEISMSVEGTECGELCLKLIDHDTALRLSAVKVARDVLSLAERCDRALLQSDARVKRAKALLKKLGEET